jgi:hypothetical protein
MSNQDVYNIVTQDFTRVYNNYKRQIPVEFKRDVRPFQGQLRDVGRKSYNMQGLQIPISEVTRTKGESVCFNDELAQTPFYFRHFPIFENAPFIPSVGDIDNDPRYGTIITKEFQSKYKQIL